MNDLHCAYCGEKTTEEIYYAPTSNMNTFDCMKCKKTNFINSGFGVIKIEAATLDDVKNAFLMATSVSWTEEQVDRMCKETLRNLKD